MRFNRPVTLIAILASILAPSFGANDRNDGVFTISVVSPTSARDVQIRYFLGSESGTVFSSSVTGSGDKLVIRTESQSKAATRFKAIAFAPGCQFVTFSVDDLSTSNRQGEFQCQKLPTTSLQGRILLSGMEGKNLQVEVLYMCNWASQFFNMGSGAVSPFLLTKIPVASDGTFSLELPDFASDPLWSSFSKDASLRFHLIDADTGKPINGLVPQPGLSKGNLLNVAPAYPGEIQFTVQARGEAK